MLLYPMKMWTRSNTLAYTMFQALFLHFRSSFQTFELKYCMMMAIFEKIYDSDNKIIFINAIPSSCAYVGAIKLNFHSKLILSVKF